MFLRSKKKENGQDGEQSSSTPNGPGNATPSERKGVTSGPMRTVAQLPPDELKRRAETAQRMAAAIGEIVGLMIELPRHKGRKLSDLKGLFLPAIRTGQYALASAQSKSRGYTGPLAAVLWASVSPEVDKRLSDPEAPTQLNPTEWKSGDVLWLVETIGDDRAIRVLVQRLRGNEWKGKPVKVRTAGAKGEPKIRILEALPNGGPAARSN